MLYLGKKIREARLKAGLTQEVLAFKIGVSRGAIARWELGEIEPKLKNLITLSEFLDVSVDYLLGINKSHSAEDLQISDEAYEMLKQFIDKLNEE